MKHDLTNSVTLTMTKFPPPRGGGSVEALVFAESRRREDEFPPPRGGGSVEA